MPTIIITIEVDADLEATIKLTEEFGFMEALANLMPHQFQVSVATVEADLSAPLLAEIAPDEQQLKEMSMLDEYKDQKIPKQAETPAWPGDVICYEDPSTVSPEQAKHDHYTGIAENDFAQHEDDD